jgi:outer membrane protein
MESFKQLLNMDLGTEITLSGSLDDVLALGSVTLGSAKLDDLVEKSLSVASLEKQVESARNSLTASRFSAYGPTINAGWTYQPTIKSSDTSNAADSGSLTLSATIPLDGWLPWSTGSDNVATANDTVKNLELQLENAKTTAKVNIQNYSRQIDQAQSTIQSLQANINLAQQSYDMTLEAYNHGTKDLLSLQTASDSLLQAKVSLKSEAYTLIKAVLNLENTSGVPFGTLGK